MTAVRVFVATTEGPSEVQRIAEEDPEVRSVVCLNGTSEALPISAAYDSFVRKPTGVIERLFGHPVFRMDVAQRIGDGRSWQLPFAVAHALHAAGRLAGRDTPAQSAVWLTGTVDNDLNVGSVGHIPEKLKQSAALFNELRTLGVPITIFLPQENIKESLVGDGQEAGMGLEGIRIMPTDRLETVFRKLGLSWTEPVRTKRKRKGRLPLILALLLIAGGAVAGVLNRDYLDAWWDRAFGEPEPLIPAVTAPPEPDTGIEPPEQPVPTTEDVAEATPEEPAVETPSVPSEPSAEPPAETGEEPAAPEPPVVQPEPDPEPVAQAEPETPPATEPTAPSESETAAPDETKPSEMRVPEPQPEPEPEPEPEPVVSAADIGLRAVEKRAPGGRSCAVATFGNRGLEEAAIGMESPRRFSTSRARGLCAVTYRFANDFSENIRVWVYAAPVGARIGFGATTSASAGKVLAPGEEMEVELQLPRWVHETLRHRVIVVAAETGGEEDLSWLDREMSGLQGSFDFARWAELRERILDKGLPLISAMHEILP